MLAFVVRPAFAQGGYIRPEPKLDSTRSGIRASFLLYRDTLRTIDAASSRLDRDLRTGGPELLASRVRAVVVACSAARRQLDPTRTGMMETPAASQVPADKRSSLERGVASLKTALDRCVQDYAALAQRPNEIRDAGRGSAANAIDAARYFERAGQSYMGALGIKVRPFGAGPSPFATSQ